jgi:type IVB pilus formation R64 PilN family outer membrane protein
MQRFVKNSVTSAVSGALCIFALGGCAAVQQQVEQLEATASRQVADEVQKAAQPAQVVTSTAASFLLGATVEVAPTQSPIMLQETVLHPAQKMTLTEVATWITANYGIMVDTAEVQQPLSAKAVAPAQVGGKGDVLPAAANGASVDTQLAAQRFAVNYSGPLFGLLDYSANVTGLWWKMSDGKISFYRTETQTFYLPALNRPSSGSLTISTTSGSSGSGGAAAGGGSTGAPATSAAPSGGGTGGAGGGDTNTTSYAVDVWKEIEKTAQAVAGSAVVVANPSLSSITVNGTPAQLKHVADWVKKQTENLTQQVSITVQMYSVKLSKENNFNWNPNVIFHSSNFGAALAGPQVPAIASGLTAFGLGANVASAAKGNAAKYSGSDLAVQALSSLGSSTETFHNTITTLNGQPITEQVASRQTYLASLTPGAATVIGTAPVGPTMTPGQVVTGFTATFLPQVIDGKVILAMHMSNSTLTSLKNIGTSGSFIQGPDVDERVFPQNIMLTPGDSFLVTALQVDNGRVNKSGVGSENNYLLGGGNDSSTGKTVIGIIITARVL